jgi:hypothetical protein
MNSTTAKVEWICNMHERCESHIQHWCWIIIVKCVGGYRMELIEQFLETLMPPQRVLCLKSVLMLFSHLRLALPSVFFALMHSNEKFVSFLISPIRGICPAHPILLVAFYFRLCSIE